jgi:hypothetical protein
LKFMLGLVAALGVAFAAYAAASTLSVEGGAIQAGEDLTLSCTDAAKVEGWGLETDTGKVHFVRISGLAGCEGNSLFASITSGGSEITACEVPAIDAAEEVCTFAAEQDASAITDIHIFIEGPNGDEVP